MEVLYENSTVFPLRENVFRIFRECAYKDIKVVMLGQDPFPNKYKDIPSACGVAFATENGYINPSLRIIIKELNRYGYSITLITIANVNSFKYSLTYYFSNHSPSPFLATFESKALHQ